MSDLQHCGLATRLLHADDAHRISPAVTAEISVATTFRQPKPSETDLDTLLSDEAGPQSHVYSRYTQPTTTRVEALLSTLLNGQALLFGSGLSAGLGVLIHLAPKYLAITAGYHGFHVTIDVYRTMNQNLVSLNDAL